LKNSNKRLKMTKGEYRVGINFNPGGNIMVDNIKTKAAELIDLVDRIIALAYPETENEVARLKALAQTHIEDGAMWAVKAATKQPME
jgi:hypothetical protein